MYSENYLDRLLYRIIQGRLRVSADGLVFFIHEPNSSLINESYYIYEEILEQAYMSGNLLEEERDTFLIEQDIWSPAFDRELEDINKKIDDMKVEAYNSFFNKSQLRSIKKEITLLNSKYRKIYSKKHIYDNTTCHGVAEQSRWQWILNNSVYDANGTKLDINCNKLADIYSDNMIDQLYIREIARGNNWRTVWGASKKGITLFDRAAVDLTRDQLTLCSYSIMYDNVYEHPESPDDKIIADDDCLDGWFIANRRKHDQDKISNSINKTIDNPKIRNAQEQFIVVDSHEMAEAVMNMNDPVSKNKIAQRMAMVEEKGTAKDLDFVDVQQDIQMKAAQMFSKNAKG